MTTRAGWLPTGLGLLALASIGCGDDGSSEGQATTDTTVSETSATLGDGDGDPSGDGDGDPSGDGDPDGDGDGDPATGDGDGEPIKFDMQELPDAGTGGPFDECKVLDDMNAVGECEESAPRPTRSSPSSSGASPTTPSPTAT